jgi:hypothetical protein
MRKEFLAEYFGVHIRRLETEAEVNAFLDHPDIIRKFSDEERLELSAMWLKANGWEELSETEAAVPEATAGAQVLELSVADEKTSGEDA